MQNDVLAGNVFTKLAFQNELDCGRNLKPRLARRHTARHIRRAYARGKRAERAVGAGMRIRADYDVARNDQALFRGAKRAQSPFCRRRRSGLLRACRKNRDTFYIVAPL